MKYPKYYQNHRSNVFAYQTWQVHLIFSLEFLFDSFQNILYIGNNTVIVAFSYKSNIFSHWIIVDF